MQRRQLLIAGLAAAPAAAVAKPASPARSVALAPPSLHIRDWGGRGRPIVFLSAWGFSADAWQYQMGPLAAQGFRCVTYDRRGHGRSSDPGRGYDIDTLADDLAAVLEAQDIRDAVLVAYSMGSGEAVRYLTRHGRGRVGKLLLLAPVTPFLTKTADNPEGVDPAAFERNRAIMQKDFPAALAAGFPTFIETGASEEIKAWAKSLMLDGSLHALIECNKTFSGTDFRPDLKRVAVPTLVIHGEADRSAPPALTGKRTAALIPGAELRMYAGAPHGLVFTHTERLNADIAAFAKT